MEKITELKFQKLETCEMDNVKGGALMKTHNTCGYTKDKLKNNGTFKSKEEGDWFYHKDEWCGAGGI